MIVGGLNITSFVPGRLRLKVDEIKHSPDFAARVREMLERVPGIQRVELNPMTGSVLVRYQAAVVMRDPGRQGLTDAIRALFPAADIAVLQSWLDRAA